MIMFGRDWIISCQLLEVEFLAIGKRLVPLLLHLALKVVTFDAGMVAVLADVVNVLETLLSHELLLQPINYVLPPLNLFLLYI